MTTETPPIYETYSNDEKLAYLQGYRDALEEARAAVTEAFNKGAKND